MATITPGERVPTSGVERSKTGTAETWWRGRPALAAAVRAAVFVVPVAASVVVSFVVGRAVTRPESLGGTIGWWALLLLVSGLTMVAVDRLARRFLPLAALLGMTLVFPDEAPSRFGVALRAGSKRRLEQRIAEIRDGGDVADALDELTGSEAILELTAALARHDRFTRGHSERVRAYAALVGEELGLDETELAKLQWGGLIHDVGKLAVPEGILNKAGRLTDEEFEIIKSHPAAGMELVEPMADWLGDWVHAVGHHHERWDGGGYPQGLAGEEISLAGRIVAVADAFDVMTAARSYKDPHSPGYAREELARNAGSQFDPAVVRAFLNISMTKLRLTMWPLSWVAQLPFVGGGISAPAAPLVATATGAVLSVGVAGGLVAAAEVPEALALVTEQEQAAETVEIVEEPVSTLPTLGEPVPTTVLGGLAVDSTTSTTSESAEPSGPAETDATTTTSATVDDVSPPTTTRRTTTTVGTTIRPTTTVTVGTTATTAAAPTTTTAAPTTTTAAATPCEQLLDGVHDLTGADLRGCDLVDAVIDGVDLRNADLRGVDLRRVDLRNFDLRGADLTDARLDDAVLADGSLAGAVVDGVRFERADIRRVGFEGADLDDSRFVDAVLDEVSFADGVLRRADFTDASVTNSDFDRANLVDALFRRTFLPGTSTRNAAADRADYTDADLNGALLDGTRFVDADFVDASARGATIGGADVAGADFRGADLTGMTGTPLNAALAVFGDTLCQTGLLNLLGLPCW